uniref:arginine kinase n=1 Tax=Heterorhabditis bacteriophora TaxID=37862 RepID=A0A1I7WTQ2_HETBA
MDYHNGFGPNQKQPVLEVHLSLLKHLKNHEWLGYSYKFGLPKFKKIFENISDPELQGTYYPLLGMTKDVQTQLIKDHFLFKEGDRYRYVMLLLITCWYLLSHLCRITFLLPSTIFFRFLQAANACRYWPAGRGIFHNKKKTFLVWANEEDHLRIISMQEGGNVGQVCLIILNLLSCHFETFYVYLGSIKIFLVLTLKCTTVRASVHIRLPKISAKPDFKRFAMISNSKFVNLLKKFYACSNIINKCTYLQIRGIHGEHSDSEGGVYDISNKAVKQMYDGKKA